jgi:hypothetical protein
MEFIEVVGQIFASHLKYEVTWEYFDVFVDRRASGGKTRCQRKFLNIHILTFIIYRLHFV